MKASEILRRYAAGERNFQGINLRGLSFQGQDLSGADFSKVDIRGTNFANANLTGAKFCGAKAGLQRRFAILVFIILFLIIFASHYIIAFAIALGFAVLKMSVSASILIVLWVGILSITTILISVIGFAVSTIVLSEKSSRIPYKWIYSTIILILISWSVMFWTSEPVSALSTMSFPLPIGITIFGVYLGLRFPFSRNMGRFLFCLGGTSFRKSNLIDANFQNATLSSTDFRDSILTRTYFRNSKLLDSIRPGNTILNQSAIRDLLVTGNGYKKSYIKADLRGANLQGANLENSNLKRADLGYAVLGDTNLKNANLTETLAIGTNFTGAYFTGACLESWNIDRGTILDRVDCQYIFLLEHPNNNGSRERRPHDPYRTFDPGDFEQLYKQLTDTIQLLLKNGINHEAFREALQKIMTENPQITWDSIQKIERKGDDVLVEITIPESISKSQIEQTFDEIYKTKLLDKEKQLEMYRDRVNYLQDIVQTLAQQPILVMDSQEQNQDKSKK